MLLWLFPQPPKLPKRTNAPLFVLLRLPHCPKRQPPIQTRHILKPTSNAKRQPKKEDFRFGQRNVYPTLPPLLTHRTPIPNRKESRLRIKWDVRAWAFGVVVWT